MDGFSMWLQHYLPQISTIITVIIIPIVVQLIKSKDMSAGIARLMSIIVSLGAGIVAGFASGIPPTVDAWCATVFAFLGGTQVVYSIFKGLGVTSRMMDALEAAGQAKPKSIPATAAPIIAYEPKSVAKTDPKTEIKTAYIPTDYKPIAPGSV